MLPHSHYKKIGWYDYRFEWLFAFLMTIIFIVTACQNPEKIEVVSKTLTITKTKKRGSWKRIVVDGKNCLARLRGNGVKDNVIYSVRDTIEEKIMALSN